MVGLRYKLKEELWLPVSTLSQSVLTPVRHRPQRGFSAQHLTDLSETPPITGGIGDCLVSPGRVLACSAKHHPTPSGHFASAAVPGEGPQVTN